MEGKQVPERDFVREKIKNKPLTHRQILKKTAVSALCGVTFALTMGLTMYVMIPGLRQQWEESMPVEDTQNPPSREPQKDSQMGADQQQEYSGQNSREPLSIEDYQRIQTELYAIGTRANRSIVTITSVVSDTDWFNNSYEREGQGSGTIIGNRDGKLFILTEKKVIKDASEIQVTFINDSVASAQLMKYDGNTGLAVLTVDKDKLETSVLSAIEVMEIGSTPALHKGSMVIALGSPLGTNYSILTGNITATNNEISTQDKNYSVYTTDIVANKNGSGILISTEGKMVGVVMQDYNTASSSTLMAVDVTELEPVMELLYGNRDVPNLGIYSSTVTKGISDKYGLPQGVFIKEIAMDSPAMKAGLRSGDVIVKLAGRKVTNAEEFSSTLLELSVGQSYPVVIMREGTGGYKKMTFQVEAGVLK
ncbi:MAG: S1C family serine protease [Lachnospiraceae bacterium]|nr:S1C family serine protease [Lachnospiraceae bacterium]